MLSKTRGSEKESRVEENTVTGESDGENETVVILESANEGCGKNVMVWKALM